MGYRSEVAYRIRFDDSATLGQFINHVFGSGDDHMIQALKECEVCFTENMVNFHAYDVKWYESYEDVQGHTKLYELVDKEDTQFFEKCGYVFYRVGEESGDIQDDSGGIDPPYDDFYTQTSIEIPFSTNYTSYGDALEKLTKDQPTEGEQS